LDFRLVGQRKLKEDPGQEYDSTAIREDLSGFESDIRFEGNRAIIRLFHSAPINMDAPTDMGAYVSEAFEIRQKYKHFRILVIGRANAGKTTLLKRVCNTTEEPCIYDEENNNLVCLQFDHRKCPF